MDKSCSGNQCDKTRRIWSLWDLMNKFSNDHVLHGLGVLAGGLCSLTNKKMSGRGGESLEDEDFKMICSTIQNLRTVFYAARLDECSDACVEALNGMERPHLDVSTAHTLIISLRKDIEKDFGNRKFLYIAKNLSGYLDDPAPFGDLVRSSFRSAVQDIHEAGNCLAAECGTACVFHLMRASEFGLHALARDRDVDFPDKPLEEKEWGQILGNLESKIGRLSQDARSNWADPIVRDAQIRFYAEVAQELRGFNDAFRRHVSHADRNAFYSPTAALGIFEHVKAFMQKLAVKISEDHITEKYWK